VNGYFGPCGCALFAPTLFAPTPYASDTVPGTELHTRGPSLIPSLMAGSLPSDRARPVARVHLEKSAQLNLSSQTSSSRKTTALRSTSSPLAPFSSYRLSPPRSRRTCGARVHPAKSAQLNPSSRTSISRQTTALHTRGSPLIPSLRTGSLASARARPAARGARAPREERAAAPVRAAPRGRAGDEVQTRTAALGTFAGTRQGGMHLNICIHIYLEREREVYR